MTPVTEPRPPDHPLSLADLHADEVSDEDAALLGRAAVQAIAAGGGNVAAAGELGSAEAAELGRAILQAIAAGGGN